MYPFYLELELVRPVSDYYRNQGYIVKREIQIGFCRADIVAFRDEVVTAVELKLHDWKKAIIQAKNYQLGADYVYLAFPLMTSFNVLRKAEVLLEREGIGLLVVNEETVEVSEIINARRSNKKFGAVTLREINRDKRKKYVKKYY